MLSPEFIHEIRDNYSRGYFLMAGPEGQLGWYQSKRHAVFPIEEPPVYPRSLGRTLRSGSFQMRINGDFQAVVDGCAARDETWISDELKWVYIALHQAGLAHSFEAWKGQQLGGGVLGIVIGRAFIGESMFYSLPNASKCALVKLWEHLQKCGFEVFDAQIQNSHLSRFGSFEISREQYLPKLFAATQKSPNRPFTELG